MAPKWFWIYVTMTWALALATPDAYAQSRTIGAVISYTGVAVSLETPVSEKHEDVFLELNLKAECNEFYAGRSEYPGVSASASWNYILKQWKSDGDNMVNLFAGPGLTVGYLQDYKAPDGLLFGLKGVIGLQCSFKRNVMVSATVAPVVGSHIVFKAKGVEMKCYRIGLQYSLIPEIGIKYCF